MPYSVLGERQSPNASCAAVPRDVRNLFRRLGRDLGEDVERFVYCGHFGERHAQVVTGRRDAPAHDIALDVSQRATESGALVEC